MTLHSQILCAMVLALLTTALAHGQDCHSGTIPDCSDSDCVDQSWLGDGYCDGVAQEWGADLCCYDLDYGDCAPNECDSCGDGVCSVGVGEDANSCPADCFCGDGVCSVGEDASSCPADCDLCPDDPDKTEPGLCGCGVADTDTDLDGTPDCVDGCPDDPAKTSSGACGCGVPEDDADLDGTPDCVDGCPGDPLKTDPGDCGCGSPDTGVYGDVDSTIPRRRLRCTTAIFRARDPVLQICGRINFVCPCAGTCSK